MAHNSSINKNGVGDGTAWPVAASPFRKSRIRQDRSPWTAGSGEEEGAGGGARGGECATGACIKWLSIAGKFTSSPAAGKGERWPPASQPWEDRKQNQELICKTIRSFV